MILRLFEIYFMKEKFIKKMFYFQAYDFSTKLCA